MTENKLNHLNSILENVLFEAEEKAGANPFYHELATAVFLIDPKARIIIGSDFKKYFIKKTLLSIDKKSSVIDHNKVFETYGSRFENYKVNQGVLNDARALSNIIRSQLKLNNIKNVLWTGPTNDGSKFGAADIVVITNSKKYPISLKFGKGQLKNLSMNTIAKTLQIPTKGEDMLADMHDMFAPEWNKLVKEWFKFISDNLKINQKNALAKETIGIKTWEEFQSRKINDPVTFYGIMGIKYKPKPNYVFLKKALSKIYSDILKPSQQTLWTQKIRFNSFEKIIGVYFNSFKKLFDANVKKLFALQLSVSDDDFYYIASGGKEWKMIPGIETFNKKLKNLTIKHDLRTSGSGYVIPLIVSTDPQQKNILLEIRITFRWSKGEMVGELITSSTKSEAKDLDWSKYFN